MSSNLRQVGRFSSGTPVASTNKTDRQVLIFNHEFYWTIRDNLSLNLLDVSTYLYSGKQIWEQSVRYFGFLRQLEFIALHLKIYTLLKSHDLDYKLFQHLIRKLCGLEPKVINKNSNTWERIRTTSGKGREHSFQGI